jgi:hypothetical protein
MDAFQRKLSWLFCLGTPVRQNERGRFSIKGRLGQLVLLVASHAGPKRPDHEIPYIAIFEVKEGRVNFSLLRKALTDAAW